jgi:hypothetical protein
MLLIALNSKFYLDWKAQKFKIIKTELEQYIKNKAISSVNTRIIIKQHKSGSRFMKVDYESAYCLFIPRVSAIIFY